MSIDTSTIRPGDSILIGDNKSNVNSSLEGSKSSWDQSITTLTMQAQAPESCGITSKITNDSPAFDVRIDKSDPCSDRKI